MSGRIKAFATLLDNELPIYGGLGDRHQQIVDGVTTNYTLDLAAGLTQVLSDGTNTYLYGNGRISQNATQTEYFLGDALGSVRQLADSAGAVTLTQGYAPYGETISSVGNGASVYQFTGESRDANGLTYLRARYLDSSTGRFTQRDPSRLEANLYLYAGANPINRIDPSGLYSQKQITRMLGGTSYLNSLHAFESGGFASGKWGVLEMLHRADTRDWIEIYTFALNGSCPEEIKTYPYPVITLPSYYARIDNVIHELAGPPIEGTLFLAGGQLALIEENGAAKFILNTAIAGDYFKLFGNKYSGFPKIATSTTTQYASYKIVWDEVSWPDFWRNSAGVTAAALITSETWVPVGLTIGAALVIEDVVNIMSKLIPVAQQATYGQSPSEESMQSLTDAIRFLDEQFFESASEELVQAQTGLGIKIPIFDVRDLYKNAKKAIYYTP
ncbi:MAG: RHS repeat-associated core domain-containing protein [Methanosarcinaceae archaeon]